MAVSTLHGMYGVQAGSALLGGITQYSVPTGTETRGEPAGGMVYPRSVSMVAQKPRASFTTMAIVAALDALGITGKSITDLTGGLNFYAQLQAEGGARASGSNHRKYAINEGLVVPTTLTVDHQGDAAIAYDTLITYDGANEPIVISDAQALPGTLLDNERFTLGPVQIESVTLTHVRSIEINFGIVAATEGADSDIWDTFAYIQAMQPVITLRGVGVDWLKDANIPLGGKAATHVNTAIYLRKRSGVTYEADGSAVHVKFTVAGLATIDPAFDVDGSEPGEVTLVMPLKHDGTNNPIVMNTASTIA